MALREGEKEPSSAEDREREAVGRLRAMASYLAWRLGHEEGDRAPAARLLELAAAALKGGG